MSVSKRLSDLITKSEYTYEQLEALSGVKKSSLQRYASGETKKIPVEAIERVAPYLGATAADILGWNPQKETHLPSNLHPLEKVYYIPILGRIACGAPILAEENIIGRTLLPDGVKADFALNCAGDSMIDADIDDGDTVFIRKQPEVENGEIAAVLIGEEATLKRVYWNGNVLTLMPANKDFAPLTYAGEEMESVSILGKATAVLKLL